MQRTSERGPPAVGRAPRSAVEVREDAHADDGTGAAASAARGRVRARCRARVGAGSARAGGCRRVRNGARNPRGNRCRALISSARRYGPPGHPERGHLGFRRDSDPTSARHEGVGHSRPARESGSGRTDRCSGSGRGAGPRSPTREPCSHRCARTPRAHGRAASHGLESQGQRGLVRVRVRVQLRFRELRGRRSAPCGTAGVASRLGLDGAQ